MNPPLSDLDPMRALLIIPSSPAPTLMEPEKFSAAFDHFVRTCLAKEPEDRPSAADLLHYSIFNNYHMEAFIDIASIVDPWIGWSWDEEEEAWLEAEAALKAVEAQKKLVKRAGTTKLAVETSAETATTSTPPEGGSSLDATSSVDETSSDDVPRRKPRVRAISQGASSDESPDSFEGTSKRDSKRCAVSSC